MVLPKHGWRDDPIVQLEKSLSSLVQGICFAVLCSEFQKKANLAEQFQMQIEAAFSIVNSVQTDTMLPMNIRLNAEEAKVVDDLLDKLRNLSRDLPELLANEGNEPICRRLRDEVAPAIDAALDAFRGRFIGTVLERQTIHRAAAESAQREIHDISRKIFFISVNASVEASRVGDQGKGFAVISTEIRELARRVEASLKELT